MEVKITYKNGDVDSFNKIDSSEETDNFLELSDENGDTKFSINLSEIRKIEWI
jgi:hypothetical protein